VYTAGLRTWHMLLCVLSHLAVQRELLFPCSTCIHLAVFGMLAETDMNQPLLQRVEMAAKQDPYEGPGRRGRVLSPGPGPGPVRRRSPPGYDRGGHGDRGYGDRGYDRYRRSPPPRRTPPSRYDRDDRYRRSPPPPRRRYSCAPNAS
jgi:hypothetical protein